MAYRHKERDVIVEMIERPSADVLEGFRALLRHDSITCAISDCMGRFNAMTSDMRPLFEGIRFVGTAVTVKTLASDLAAAFKAIDVSEPGDVVVIDSHGSVNTAFWGENMTMSALNRGVIAAVVDGACRDVEEIRKIGFPVICKGIVPNVAAIAGYGDVNVPIQCAGVSVSPGDVVVADGNGVVIVPMSEADTVLNKAQRLLATEGIVQDKIRAGATIGELIDVDKVLRSTFSYQDKASGGD
jgi:4-hydroxy-4-methyl-2-oxoglutarate aldolase